MPFISIKISRMPEPVLIDTLSNRVLDLTVSILGKKRDLTSIAIEYTDPDLWLIGGVRLSTLKKHSFYLNITITDETNTKDEKADYIAAIFDAMGETLGDLHPESYIHIHDARADAYGYGGLTQAHRYYLGKHKA